jgi:uncharacterized protein (TIGR02757 family)
MKLKLKEIKELLDLKADQFNAFDFIETDPIQIPHRYTNKEDIEIIAFLVASIAWGNRTMIIRSGDRLEEIMEHKPFDFIMNYQSGDALNSQFVHRTFNAQDVDFFFSGLRHIYENAGGIEKAFSNHQNIPGVKGRIIHFREIFNTTPHLPRSEKHISDPVKNSAAKRLNMYLRWMVRADEKGVDFGIWKTIQPSELYLPLDVHTGKIARKLGILKRKQDDWKALEELMEVLRMFDPKDPVKYDFALFGLGAFEKF